MNRQNIDSLNPNTKSVNCDPFDKSAVEFYKQLFFKNAEMYK